MSTGQLNIIKSKKAVLRRSKVHKIMNSYVWAMGCLEKPIYINMTFSHDHPVPVSLTQHMASFD
jgi:hypothetical protein